MNLKSREKIVIGIKYGYLTLTGASCIKNQKSYVEAECVCGNKKYYYLSNLKRGNTTSCGCSQKRIVAATNFRHGCSTRQIHHPLYDVYNSMKERCYNKNKKSYKNYGLRGIIVCKEWLEDFKTFYNWAMKNGWQKGLTLERMNNDKIYEPSNCRFATQHDQQRNKTNNIFLTAFGETKCLQDWSNDIRCVMSLNGLWLRIKRGWGHQLAIVTPSLNKKAA